MEYDRVMRAGVECCMLLCLGSGMDGVQYC